jgi:rhodanese-related sulfurtransferase
MPIKNIDSETLKKWLDNNEAVIVDVREPAEYQANKINGSSLIPLANICKKSLPQCQNKKLVLHCHSGKRSQSACQKLLAEDSDLEIYNLEGGISAWIVAGNAAQKSGSFFLPLDRQVQLAIGLGVLAGSLLGYFVHPAFCFLAAFFGAGLSFAGLSGYCGLAILMAKMPWNRGVKASSSCSIG